jgi:peroxiredoxin
MAGFFLAIHLRRKAPWDETPEAMKAEILGLLDRVVKEFHDVPLSSSSTQTLLSLAEPIWYELKHLNIGQKAPEIEGEGAFGEQFRLSHFEGKVVILDFFADWCPYCRRMYPDYRAALSGKFRNRPLEIIGVSADEKDVLQDLISTNQITWRTWWDGPRGPIARLWNIDSYPAIYILDHEGIIRHKISGKPGPQMSQELNTAVEQLVKKAERDNSRGGKK